MGSLAGVFNACSTLFTVDIYQKWRPTASQHQIVRTGRIATTIMVLIAMAWIPVVQGAHGLYNYLQSVQGYLAPPIFVVFFFGVFWKRLNAQGCLWAMVVGFILGLFRMLVDTPVTHELQGFKWLHGRLVPLDHQQHQLPVFQHPHHPHLRRGDGRGELLTSEPDYEKIKSLTFGTATDEDNARRRRELGRQEVAASIFVLVFILGGYLYFRG